jgi:signal transduction histidine kinase/ActR/RegA family two-component response regulator
MSEKWKLKSKILVILVAVVCIGFFAGIYMVQLQKTISENIFQNISELAEHDQDNILSYIESTWEELSYIQGDYSAYGADSLDEMMNFLAKKCANSTFDHLWMIGDNGTIYTDENRAYLSGEEGTEDFLAILENGQDRIVCRFEDAFPQSENIQNGIVYGIELSDTVVEGIQMKSLVAINDISSIEDKLKITSFEKNGATRGYSVVIDMNGDLIAQVDQNLRPDERDSFFARLRNGERTDLTAEEMSEKMQAGEKFTFGYTNSSGVDRIIYAMPFQKDGIPWYYLYSVERVVFTEQNLMFLKMSMGLMAGIGFVVICVLIILFYSQHKILMAKAEAEAKSSFLANMSHEIRTPLNGIIGLIFLMEKDLESGKSKEIFQQRLGKAKATADYLLSLINNILDISKLQAGKVDLKDEVLSLDEVMDNVYTMQKSNIEGRGINFIYRKELTCPWVIGDELLIKQVLMNILGNAAKFTPEGGYIHFSVRQENANMHHVDTIFTCADTGCGMSQQFLNHIWDTFSQERGKNTSQTKGTGLGMAISKLLVDAMGGKIRVESQLKGGSVFQVTLRLKVSKAAPGTEVEEAETSESRPTGKILLAEDNELNAEILMEILEGEGFEVVPARNGQEAVDRFRESEDGEIRIILMDMQMPIMDGCEATAEIRKMDRPDAKTVRIFACTANNFNEDRERAEQSGMDDFLSKPVDVKVLLKKLSR